MFKSYRQLWAGSDVRTVSQPLAWLGLLVAVVLPILVGVGIYDHDLLKGVIVVVGGTVGAVLFFHLRYFMLFVFPVIYAVIEHRFQFVMTGVLAVSYVVQAIKDGRLSFKIPYPWLMFLIVATGLLGMVKAQPIGGGVYVFVFLIFVPLLTYFIFYNVGFSNEDIRLSILVVSVLSAFIGYMTLLLYLKTGISRIVFAWPNHNRLSGFFGLIIPYSIVFLLDKEQKDRRWIWGGIAFGLCIGVAVAQTRAIMASTVVALIYITLMMRSWRVFIILTVAGAVALALAPSLILSRFEEISAGSQAGPDLSTLGRLELWLASYKLMPEYWLKGMGLGMFGKVVEARYGFKVPGSQPHNIFLHWIFGQGIVGLTAYIAVITTVIVKAHRAVWRAMKREDNRRVLQLTILGINGGLVSMMTASWLDTYIGVPAIAAWFWILIGYQSLMTERLNYTELQPNKETLQTIP